MSEYTFSSPEEQEAHFELTHDTNMRKIEAECKPQAPEASEDWETGLRVMLNGMTFPDQIVSHVKALLKAEREKVLGEIEALVNPPNKDYDAEDILDQIDAKIAEIRGE